MASTISAGTTAGTAIAIAGDTTGNLAFQTNGTTTAMTINTSQGVSVLNCLAVGNATPSTSGAGITFPATQSASSDANTLDDYEEGEWTARLTSDTPPSSVPQTQGNYTKVGNLVTVFVRFTNVNTSGGSGTMFISGLPFTSAATTEQQSAIPMMYGLNVSGAYISAYIGQSQTRIDFIGVSNNAAWSNVNMTAGSAKYFNMSITYRAA
jgi:hypothetical protein